MHAGEASRGSFAVMDDIEQMERDQTERAARPLRVDRLGAAALLAFAAAFLVNLVIRWLGQAVLGVAEDEELLSTLSIALTTLFGAGAGAVGLYVLAAQAARPLLAFRRLAVLALALSLLGPLSAVLGWVAPERIRRCRDVRDPRADAPRHDGDHRARADGRRALLVAGQTARWAGGAHNARARGLGWPALVGAAASATAAPAAPAREAPSAAG